MIFVSGTKRSGTSMWMQILSAAGLPVLGKAFPRNWGNTSLRDANPDGFYESVLREGVYYRTNPHPTTGQYFLPEHVTGYAVKVFVPGVIRSERAYIDHLIANIRPWREYEASILRLYALEAEDRKNKRPDAPEPFNFPPAYEWWMENFALCRDISLRRYPVQLQTYEQVLTQPEVYVGKVIERIGVGDVQRAVEAVRPERRTQTSTRSDSVEPSLAKVFDDLYGAIESGEGLTRPLLETMNATNRALLPLLTDLQTKVVQSYAQVQKPVKAEPLVGLPRTS